MTLRERLADAYRTPVALAVPLPVAECLQRVQGETASVFSFSKAALEKRLVGSVYGQVISVRYRIDYRNDFRRVLDLRFVPVDGGSQALGGFVISPFILIFLCVFCGITGLISLGLLVSLINGSVTLDHNSSDFLGLIPVGMFLFAPTLLAIGLATSRGTERQTLALIKELLGAEEMVSPPPRT